MLIRLMHTGVKIRRKKLRSRPCASMLLHRLVCQRHCDVVCFEMVRCTLHAKQVMWQGEAVVVTVVVIVFSVRALWTVVLTTSCLEARL